MFGSRIRSWWVMVGAASAVWIVPSAVWAEGGCAPDREDPSTIATVARWILALQYSDPALASYGAVRIHDSPGLLAPDGRAYYRVIPHPASLSLWGLLRTSTEGK